MAIKPPNVGFLTKGGKILGSNGVALGERLKPLAGLADDAVLLGRNSLAPSITPPDASDAAAAKNAAEKIKTSRHAGKQGNSDELDALKDGWNLESKPIRDGGKTVPANRLPPEMIPPASKPAGVFNKLENYVAKPADKLSQAAGAVSLGADFALPVLGFVAGIIGLKKTREKIRAPHEFMKNTKVGKMTLGNTLLEGSFAVGGAVEGFRVAHSFSEKVDRLKTAMSDITGVPAEQITTMKILTGDIPNVLKATRSHIIKEHLSRGLINGLGLGLILRGMSKGTGTGMLALAIPQLGSMGLDALMGEDALVQIYPTMKAAVESRQPVSNEMYAEFLFAASPELKHRGLVGHKVALEVAKGYVGVHPKDILLEMDGGAHSKFMERVNAVVVPEPAKAAVPAVARDAAMHSGSVGDRVNGRKQRGVQGEGKFTKRLSEENHGVVPSVT